MVKAGVGGSFPLSGSVPAQVLCGKEAKTTVKAGLAASFLLSGSVPAQVVIMRERSKNDGESWTCCFFPLEWFCAHSSSYYAGKKQKRR